MKKLLLATLALTSVITFSETIHQIQGVTHTSPYNQKNG